MEKNTALEKLTTNHGAAMLAEITRDMSAIAARDAGATWTEIGDALGITKQRAQQRYSGEDRARIERNAAAADRGRAEGQAILDEIRERVWGTTEPAILATDVAGTSETPSIFLDPIQNVPANTEDEERAAFWEAKRRYAVTVDGAIYSPRGEHGWDLHKVLRNVLGVRHPQHVASMAELISQHPGVLFIDREHYALAQNAATDREVWLMAAMDSKKHSVSANPAVTEDITAMVLKFDKINAQLKAKRTRKAPTK